MQAAFVCMQEGMQKIYSALKKVAAKSAGRAV
jgi:hypothetical protein